MLESDIFGLSVSIGLIINFMQSSISSNKLVWDIRPMTRIIIQKKSF